MSANLPTLALAFGQRHRPHSRKSANTLTEPQPARRMTQAERAQDLQTKQAVFAQIGSLLGFRGPDWFRPDLLRDGLAVENRFRELTLIARALGLPAGQSFNRRLITGRFNRLVQDLGFRSTIFNKP